MYWLLRTYEYLPPEKNILSVLFSLAIWVLLIVIWAYARKPYFKYLSSHNRIIISLEFRRYRREPNRALAVHKLKHAGISFACALLLAIILTLIFYLDKHSTHTLKSILETIGILNIGLLFICTIYALCSLILSWFAYLGIFKFSATEQVHSPPNDESNKE